MVLVFGLLFHAVKDALAVESSVRVVRDAYQRQLAAADKETQAGGLTAEQFQAACKELSNEKGFRNFKELAEDNGMSAAVYSRYYLVNRSTPEQKHTPTERVYYLSCSNSFISLCNYNKWLISEV